MSAGGVVVGTAMNTVETFPDGVGFVGLKDQFQLTGQKVAVGVVNGLRKKEPKCLLQVRFQRFLTFVKLLLDLG